MHHQAHEYFGMLGIRNVGNKVLPNLLVISALQKLDNDAKGKNIYDKVRSDMISKAIEGSITKKYLKKLRLH